MDPKFRSSFIPKKTVSGVVDSSKVHGPSTSVLSIASGAIFIIALIFALGAFGYQLFLDKKVNAKGVELETFRQQIEIEKIAEVEELDRKIRAAEQLLDNHISLTRLFEYLESATLPNVQFKSFGHEINSDDSFVTNLNGVALDYSTLALQSEIFGRGDVFSDVAFSGISLDNLGRVLFSIEAKVSRNNLLYFQEE